MKLITTTKIEKTKKTSAITVHYHSDMYSIKRRIFLKIIDNYNKLIENVARFVSFYSCDILRQNAGHHSQKICQIIGYKYGSVTVNRNDMIIR